MYWRQLVLWCSQPSTANSEAIYSCRPSTFISVSGFLFNDSDTSISWLSSRTSPQALVTALLVRILRVYIFEQLRHILPTFWSNHCLSYFPLPLPQFGHLPNYVGASWPCYAGDHDSHFYSEADDDEIQMSLEFHGIGNIPANTINPTHLRPFRCSPSCGADKVDEACIGIWDLYVPTHLCRPRRVPRFSGSSAFISLHLFQGIEAKLSMIWHIVSAVQLSIRFFLVHPNSSCVIAGWTWTIAETWHIVSAMQLILRIFLIHPISCCVIAGWAWIVAETVL